MLRGFLCKLSAFLIGVGSSLPGFGNVEIESGKGLEIAMRTIVVDAPPPFSRVEILIDVRNSYVKELRLMVDGNSISIPESDLKGICDIEEPDFELLPRDPPYQKLRILAEYGRPYLYDVGQIYLDGPKNESITMSTILAIDVDMNMKAKVARLTMAEDGSGGPRDASGCEIAGDAAGNLHLLLDYYGKQ